VTDEILILDGGSIDNTLDIAKKYSCKCIQNNWPGNYSLQRNIGLDLINTDWVLVIDSDEFLDKRVSTVIRKIILWCNKYEIDIVWFGRRWLSRLNFREENIIDCCSFTDYPCFWPDPSPRLFRMNKKPSYRGIIHNLLFCKEARYASIAIVEDVFINHVRIICFPEDERKKAVDERNSVDPGNVSNLQLLPEFFEVKDNLFHEIHLNQNCYNIAKKIVS